MRRSSPAAAQAFGRSAPYAWILRGLCALFVVRDGKAPCAASVKSREIERRSVKPRSAALKGQPGLGRERHSEDSGRAFMGVNAACQRPGAERSAGARRSAFFAERGLTGRDPRAYPPATSEWLGYSHREAYRWRAYGSYFPKCFSESLRDCRTPLTVTKTAHCLGHIPSRTLLGVCRESSHSGLSPLPHRRRTKARTHTGQQHTRRQRPRFRIFAQPSTDQHVYAQSALLHPAGTH